jgi:hypothetical protein
MTAAIREVGSATFMLSLPPWPRFPTYQFPNLPITKEEPHVEIR